MGKNESCPGFRGCDKIFAPEVSRILPDLIFNILLFPLIGVRWYITTEESYWICFITSCSGLQKYLNQQGFNIVGYGCTTCIGNSGDLDESVSSAITDNGRVWKRFAFLFFIYPDNLISFSVNVFIARSFINGGLSFYLVRCWSDPFIWLGGLITCHV